jgi:hypothetical protein
VLNKADIAIIILIVTCSRLDIDDKLLIWRETTLTHSAMVISYNYVILTLQFEETFQQYPPHPLYLYILYTLLIQCILHIKTEHITKQHTNHISKLHVILTILCGRNYDLGV